ncbi:hypothetical protein NA57DRAFT_72118 [Rhizodiscina lignyota]|uniref:Uncharacterized protein n=1 Tax=Rhizodiscina lignyota TaxID=1504668 RepID=A0A9P4MF13_9PEZI|nr:hypothetical protein NA57DRAFT_72118 [Rhizodiscina lignyota]
MQQKFWSGKETAVAADAADPNTRFALEQYNKAIQQIIMTSGSGQSADQAITMGVCVLFPSLSSIQGHQEQTLIHLETGMKILERLETIRATRQDLDDLIPISFPAARSLFKRLNVQSRFYLSLENLQTWHSRKISVPQAPINTFDSTPAALAFFVDLFYVLTLVMQSPDSPQGLGPSNLLRHLNSIQVQFTAGEAACTGMLHNQGSSLTKKDIRGLQVLGIYRVSIKLFLKIAGIGFDRKEMDWDELQPEFREIFRLSCTIYDAPPDDIVQYSRQLSSDTELLKNGPSLSKRLENGRPPQYASNPGNLRDAQLSTTRRRLGQRDCGPHCFGGDDDRRGACGKKAVGSRRDTQCAAHGRYT